MVQRLWKSSLTAWLLSALRETYNNGFFCALLVRVACAVKSSVTAYHFSKIMLAAQNDRTWYNGTLCGFNSLVRRIARVAGNGIFAAALRAIGRGYSRVTRGSVIFGALSRLGVRRMLLLAFAMFLPLDVLFRSGFFPSAAASLWDEALLAAMLLYALYDTARSREEPRITPVDSPLILFFSIGIILVILVSPTLSIAVAGFRAVFQYMLFFPALVRLVKNERDSDLITLSLLGIGVVMAFHGIYQYIIAVPIPSNWVSMSEAGVRTRAFSIVGSPNILGDFMIMAAPVAVSMAYRVKAMKPKLFFWGCFGVLCVCSLVTFSRGAWIGLAAAAVIFALMIDKRLFALMLFAGAAILLVPEVSNRLGYLFTPEFQASNETGGRSMRWEYGMELLKTKGAFLGVGLGRFGGAVAMQNKVMVGINYFYLDNYYMKTLVEMGYLGLAGYILLLASSLWTSLRAFLRCSLKRARIQTAALFSAVCGVLAHCFFENIFEVPYMNAYFWCFIALMVCRGFVWKRTEKF